MARTIVTIPRAVLRAVAFDWDIDWRGQSSSVGTGGDSQTVFNRFPRWVGQPVLGLTRANLLAWRAIRAQAQGRVAVYRVPMEDAAAPGAAPCSGVTFAGGQGIATTAGLAQEPFVLCAGGASAGATEIVVTPAGQTVVAGQYMSHDDWPFIVTSVLVEGADLRLGVQMPLRAAIPDGGLIRLRAVGLFEAADDATGNPATGMRPHAEVPMGFREWLGR